jgi:tetratricopeptide (TPR) repeat protein
MHNLAAAYQTAGQPAKALPLHEQALTKFKEALGPDHPDTLHSMNALASAYQATGQLDRALPLYEQVLAKRQEKLGPDHPDTLTGLNNLAMAYQAAGQPAKARPLFEQALAKSKEKLGPSHPNTLTFMNNLAVTYLALKQPDKAIPLLHDFLAKHRQRLGADSPGLAGLLALVGQELLKSEHFAEAEPIVGECLRIRTAQKPDAWTTFNTQSMLGGSLAGQKKYAEAEPLLLAGYEGMKQRAAQIPSRAKVRLTEALDRLVQLYDAWGKPDQAARWRAERDKLPKPPEPPKAK